MVVRVCRRVGVVGLVRGRFQRGGGQRAALAGSGGHTADRARPGCRAGPGQESELLVLGLFQCVSVWQEVGWRWWRRRRVRWGCSGTCWREWGGAAGADVNLRVSAEGVCRWRESQAGFPADEGVLHDSEDDCGQSVLYGQSERGVPVCSDAGHAESEPDRCESCWEGAGLVAIVSI